MNISQKIIDYAIWYYLRYYPSTKKLEQKLEEKFGKKSENGKKYGGIGKAEIHYIITENLRNIIQEDEVIRTKIRNYKSKGKNISYIQTNLLKKGFIMHDISKILENEFQSQEVSLLDEEIIRKKIENYKNKGKSKNFLRQKFIERSIDKEIVEEILQEVFSQGEDENLLYEYKKLEGKFEKQKIIEKLLRKGFIYDDIKRIVL